MTAVNQTQTGPKSIVKSIQSPFILAFVAICLACPSFAGPVLWTLSGVQFTDGTTASGSFVYDVDANTVTNVDIVGPLATYTSTASTFFGLQPHVFVFIPSVPLVTGADIQALVLISSPIVSDAGGTVALDGVNGFSSDGLICHSDCSSVGTDKQIDAGSLVGAAIPEPGYAALAGLLLLATVAFRRRLLVS